MNRIIISDGLQHVGIGYIFICLFLWFFLYLLYLCVREQKLKKKREQIRALIEEGNRKKHQFNEQEQKSVKSSDKIASNKEEPSWEEKIRKRAKDDFGLLK